MTVTKYEFVKKHDKVLTDVPGGVCLKPATSDGVVLHTENGRVFMPLLLVVEIAYAIETRKDAGL